jgi:hypothetical protein
MPKCCLCNDFQRSARQFRLTFDCNKAELSRSANNGCVVCSLLLEGSRHFESKLEGLKDHDRIHIWGDNVDGGGSVEMEIFRDGALKLRLEFFVAKGKTSYLKGARMLPTIPGDTRAPASTDWAKQRLQQCIDSHTFCGQRSVPKLPTRVLEIGPDKEDRLSVKLLRTRGVEGRYACLSHRWSKPATLVTESSNFASHAKGIDWVALPKTFKEAILIAKDLGLRYIWIDSLCIIQNNEDDKQRELAMMSSIYANSHITIAATQSDGEMRGCYSAGSFYHQDHRLSLKQPDATTVEADLYVREKITHIGERGVVTPLLKRGWVCQERLLSPRVLHFCEKELVWECEESSSCQCSCFDPPIRLKEKYSEIFRHIEVIEENAAIVAVDDVSISDAAHPILDIALPEQASRIPGFDGDGVEPRPGIPRISFGPEPEYISSQELDDNVILKWRQIIHDYSGMDLSKKSDRLPAIAGVASQIGELLNSKYLAGLWQTALPGDLLWRTDHTIESGQHRSDYRAPSWSWASVDGKIKHYAMQSYHPEFSIVHRRCIPVTETNPFGEVTSGWLEVNARTAFLRFTLDLLEDRTQTCRRLKVEFLKDSAIFIPDYDIAVAAAAKHARLHRTHHMEYKFLCVGDFNIGRNDATVSDPYSGESLAVSLVLQQVDGGRYERVGILERTKLYPRNISTVIRNMKMRETKGKPGKGWEFRTVLMLI